MVEYKQVILLRSDLKLPLGKSCSQVAHASVDCALKTSKVKLMKWKLSGAKKVVLKVKDDKELVKYLDHARGMRLRTSLITDAGRTVFKSPTVTCLGIGPDNEKKIDEVSGKLKMV